MFIYVIVLVYKNSKQEKQYTMYKLIFPSADFFNRYISNLNFGLKKSGIDHPIENIAKRISESHPKYYQHLSQMYTFS